MPSSTANNNLITFISDLFSAIDSASIRFAMIHNGQNLEKSLESDFDIALSCHPLKEFYKVLKIICKKHNLSILNILHYEIPHGYYFIIATRDIIPAYIHLDCLYDPYGINSYYLSTSYLIDNRISVDNYYRVDNTKMALHLLLKRSIKPGINESRLTELFDALNIADTTETHNKITEIYGKNGISLVNKLTSSQNITEAEIILKSLCSIYIKRYVFRHPVKLVIRKLYDGIRKFKRFIHPTGFFIVIMGPDGCGKSTISELLKVQLARAYRQQHHFHWRPGILPKPGRASPADASETSAAPATKSKYKGPVSYARFFYYAIDFILGYWIKLYPIKAQTGFIIGERYYTDIAIHPARYGFSTPVWLIRLVGKLVPNPDMIILLSNKPDIIHQRKAELPVETIKAQLEAYKREIGYWGDAVIVDTSDRPEEVASTITKEILKRQTNTTSARFPHV